MERHASFWIETAEAETLPTLSADPHVDAIVGGGNRRCYGGSLDEISTSRLTDRTWAVRTSRGSFAMTSQ
jgi:hypothetical protein